MTTTPPRLKARSVELSVPATTEYTQIVRLVVAGVGNAIGLNLEEIEDLKLAVGEACYNALGRGTGAAEQLSIKASADSKKLVVDVQQRSEKRSLPRLFAAGDGPEKSIGVVLMKHLVDKVEYKTGAGGAQIRLIKFRHDGPKRDPSMP